MTVTIPSRSNSLRSDGDDEILIIRGRGLARNVDVVVPYPALERADEPVVGPLSYILEGSRDAVSSYHGTPTQSGPSTPSYEADTQSSMSASHCWTTASGNTTGRSRSSVDSSYSWGDDEWDRHASRVVRQMFDRIDSMLYEEKKEGPEATFKECREWVTQFPHIRVLGSQVMAPQDIGYVVIQRDSPRLSSSSVLQDITEQEMISTQDIQGLVLVGRPILAKICPVDGKTHRPPSELSYLEEEIFEQDGDYEEIFAIDYRDIHEEHTEQKKVIVPRRQRLGFPPITPNACLRDTVTSSVFDYIWTEALECAGKLIKQYSTIILEDEKSVPGLESSPHHHDPLLYREHSYFKFNRLPTGSSQFDTSLSQLDDVLKVTRKELQLREKSNLHDIAESQSPTALDTSMIVLPSNNRPLSTTTRRQRPGSITTQRDPRERLSASLRRPIVPRAGAGVRLTPLHVPSHIIDSRSRTPSVEDSRSQSLQNEVVKGHRLPIGTDRLNSPPSGLRNTGLPPMDMIKRVHNRASSALVTDKDATLRMSYREQILLAPENYNNNNKNIGRPSTTHAFHRSETPGFGNVVSRQSSTPLGMLTMTVKQGHSLGHPSYLGITGSGIHHQNVHELDQIPHNDPEDPDPYDEAIHSQWTPTTTRNNPYSRSRQQSSFVISRVS